MYSENRIGYIGKSGEDFVCEYLRSNGNIVIKRNFSNRFGEIDIVAEDCNNIVFVEVKTRAENSLVEGVFAVDNNKVNRIRNVANDFISKLFVKKEARFDVALVTYSGEGENISFKLEYIKSAF